MTEEICPMFSDHCRHCSHERSRHPCTWIVRDGSVYKPVRTGTIVRELGEFCNNHPIGSTGWVKDMVRCPVRWLRANPPQEHKMNEMPKKRKNEIRVSACKMIMDKKKPERVAGQQKKGQQLLIV